MTSQTPFKWRHFLPDIILWGVGWYCLYPIRRTQLGRDDVRSRSGGRPHNALCVEFRGMRSYLDKRCRPHLKPTNDSWRVDETYIKVKGEDRYLYRAVDSEGNTLDFLLTACEG